MINFSLQLKTRMYFGKGCIENLENEVSAYNKILLVYGGGSIKENGIYQDVVDRLAEKKVEIFELDGIKPNPSVESVREGIKICKDNDIPFILAVGGGSVIDAAKAMAAGIKYNGDIWDLYLDDSKVKEALPIGVILTLSATGSETNGNSVVTNEKTRQKLAIHNDCLRAQFAILDPSYTFTLPAVQTAAGISDIMAHVFEQYFSPTKDAFLTDKISESILKTCIKFGPVLLKEPENYEARAEIMWASTIALNGLISAGKISDWATHVMEHEVSAFYDLNHGIGLAILFPNWMKYVADDERLWKFREYGVNVWDLDPTLSDKELAELSIQKTKDFFKSLNLPTTLAEVNIDKTYLEDMAENLSVRCGTLGNFKVLGKKDISIIYKLAL